jgi:hypothetical protein
MNAHANTNSRIRPLSLIPTGVVEAISELVLV